MVAALLALPSQHAAPTCYLAEGGGVAVQGLPPLAPTPTSRIGIGIMGEGDDGGSSSDEAGKVLRKLNF
ncbi:hypothetical protein SYNPS1DRAFT_24184 [Syncephalis pseudoplumigaleata]|uniref:Uncharacterized protein n=1 Tax=Syncephalis pseudoplumigaleata TaxID=1712513 RepID=A0A4P9YWQ0_9FUNG|nr:hypothetical protein SYNPS1DRAFT_24184 [Syncephalis pseudoplumigaleata]|eukprot:RKP23741.1 hypothetical protein SYNPS1DRAFT_24184 [Syncephalis pseudoplumigaleata]